MGTHTAESLISFGLNRRQKLQLQLMPYGPKDYMFRAWTKHQIMFGANQGAAVPENILKKSFNFWVWRAEQASGYVQRHESFPLRRPSGGRCVANTRPKT